MVLYNDATYEGRQEKIYKYGAEWNEDSITYFFDDYNDVLSALIAKSNNDNMLFVKKCKEAEKRGEQHPHTPDTVIDKLQTIWNDIFPQRELVCDDSKFYAITPARCQDQKYLATKMSDGERSALYFIAQVLCVPEGKTLLIDEPELHLHKSLMNRLWSSLERNRPDCLFIYITHDTQFASMHSNADKYWVKEYIGNNHWKIEKIEEQGLPEDLLLDLLGNRKNVLFVEGEKGSIDNFIYSLLYKDYYIVPCGSCDQVIMRTKAFNNTTILHHYKAYGIIDRDYRSIHELDAYKKDNIFTLEVAEVENLFIVEEVIRAIAKLHGDEDAIFHAVKEYVIKERFEKQIDTQICQAVVWEIKHRLEIINIKINDESEAKKTLDTGLKAIDFDVIKKEIGSKFKEAKDSDDYRKVIKVFNQKGIAKSIGHFMSIENKEFFKVVCGMLRNGTLNAERLFGAYLPSAIDIPR